MHGKRSHLVRLWGLEHTSHLTWTSIGTYPHLHVSNQQLPYVGLNICKWDCMSQWLPMSTAKYVLGPHFLVVMKEHNDYIELIKESHNQMSVTQHVINWKIYIYISKNHGSYLTLR